MTHLLINGMNECKNVPTYLHMYVHTSVCVCACMRAHEPAGGRAKGVAVPGDRNEWMNEL